MARFLRRIPDGKIFIWTQELAALPNMAPYDRETAEKRIEALKANLEAKAEGPTEPSITQEDADLAKELTDLENQLRGPEDQGEEKTELTPKTEAKTNEQLAEEARNKRIAEDPHVVKITAMTKKADVRDYISIEFGEDVDISKFSLKDLKAMALDLRINRIFETESG